MAEKKTKQGSSTRMKIVLLVLLAFALASVIVPKVLDNAAQKSETDFQTEAEDVLTELEKTVAVANSKGEELGDMKLGNAGITVTYGGIVSDGEFYGMTKYTTSANAVESEYYVDENNEVARFSYRNTLHYANWTESDGWFIDLDPSGNGG